MDSGELQKDLNYVIKVLEIRELQKRVSFLLLKGNHGGFFPSEKMKFFKRRNSEHGVSIAVDMSVFRKGLKY